eukprot:5243714-Prymnesium_polylepis.1
MSSGFHSKRTTGTRPSTWRAASSAENSKPSTSIFIMIGSVKREPTELTTGTCTTPSPPAPTALRSTWAVSPLPSTRNDT